MKNLIKKIQNTIFQQSLLKKGDKIILGISGGPDSVCLLHVFLELQKKSNLSLIVAHVNYGLRRKDSNLDEKFVRNLAGKYDLKIEILKPKIQAKNNLEENLRDIRYDFFEKIRKKNNFNLIAVAHNLDDQAETFLMRLIRGSGLQGLSAMQFKNNSRKIIRPLLNITRQEILIYLKTNKLKYKIDKTNLQSIFLRNKIRNKLIPYIEKNFNPRVKQVLSSTAKSCGEDYAVIESATEKFYNKEKELSVKKLLKLPTAIQKRVLQKIIFKKNPKITPRDFSFSEEIIKALKSAKSKNQTINFARLKMIRKGDKINLS
ncbi:MAG TPA: tRNA lysidine(34) synthetase TilS [Candidatus Moranbacteria bacterium]|nr:tRNA lysidine(34) synthetase TilS [Candidatus Moranbacteria bacterium]HAT75159.1 tRNA lysidine(34) synthetase TilS [Candidatus Moranbacteria bacterium]